MSDDENFNARLSEAIAAKSSWFNSTALPKMHENYQLLFSCVKNLYEIFEKQGLIVPDPYKVEKKYEDIELPPEENMKESEISNIMGVKFSEYVQVLEFVCSYYKFSTDFLTLDHIAKLNLLNNFIIWSSCTPSNPKPNTKAIGLLVSELKTKLSGFNANTITDTVRKSAESISEITKTLKELSDFQKESYKSEIRNVVMCDATFDAAQASQSAEAEEAEIRKKYAPITGKKKIYTDLIQEITSEDFAEDKAALRENIFRKLQIAVPEQPKKQRVNPRTILMDSINTIAALDEEYTILDQIVVNNYHVLESERNTIIDKLKRLLRAAFNLKPKPVNYMITVEDTQKKTRVLQKLDINVFINNLERKGAFYSMLADHSSVEYQKILSSEPDPLLQFVSKQLYENKEILTILTGLDEYFKTRAAPKNKSKIKGLKMELLTLQNAIIKANQRRAEYVSTVEEYTQMHKLGINLSD